MKNKPDDKIAFNLGWDFYSHGFILPNRLNKEEFDLMLKGFSAARKRNIPKTEHDRYIKKWLNLRIGAWTRGRTFDNQVTPEFIKRIDVKKCPVTDIILTHGTGSLSDWSVDRVNNDAAYSPGNLVIVSSLANISKGSLSYKDIVNITSGLRPVPYGVNGMRPLSTIEWLRWRSIASHVITIDGCDDAFGYAVAPCVCIPPQNISVSPSSALQMAISLFVLNVDSKPLNTISAKLIKSKRVNLNKIVVRAKKNKSNQMRLGDFWFNERLFTEFTFFFNELSPEETRMINHVGYKTMSNQKKDKERMICDVSEWNLHGKGYDKPITLTGCAASPALNGEDSRAFR